jgi:uncharacterized paraquat-inducible protein A
VTGRARPGLVAANLVLLVAFPVAWFAPLMSVRLWRFGSDQTVSVISGLQGLWAEDVALALAVTFFAIVAPVVKVLGLGLVQTGLASPRLLGPIFVVGKLAMADVFLVAVWIVAFKGLGIGSIEVLWGLYLFTACVLGALLLSVLTERQHRRR